jgi:hypothetical protein
MKRQLEVSEERVQNLVEIGCEFGYTAHVVCEWAKLRL